MNEHHFDMISKIFPKGLPWYVFQSHYYERYCKHRKSLKIKTEGKFVGKMFVKNIVEKPKEVGLAPKVCSQSTVFTDCVHTFPLCLTIENSCIFSALLRLS